MTAQVNASVNQAESNEVRLLKISSVLEQIDALSGLVDGLGARKKFALLTARARMLDLAEEVERMRELCLLVFTSLPTCSDCGSLASYKTHDYDDITAYKCVSCVDGDEYEKMERLAYADYLDTLDRFIRSFDGQPRPDPASVRQLSFKF